MRTLLLATALLIFQCPAHAAKKSAEDTPVSHRYSVLMDGKEEGTYTEAFTPNKANLSLVTVQEWATASGDHSHIETLTSDDKSTSPISFDLHYTAAAGKKELKINAIVQRTKSIADMHYKMIKIKPAPLSRDEKTFPMAAETIFFSSLPRYLARHESGMYTARAIMEDVRSLEYVVKLLKIRRTDEARAFDGLNCERSYVDLQGPMAEFWVAKDGTLCQVLIQENKTLIRLKAAEAPKAPAK